MAWYDADEESSRFSRGGRSQRSQRNVAATAAAASVPLSYNHHQHSVQDAQRAALNLCTNVYRKTDYDRLALSLSSPLPNEQDFGMNVCTLISHEGRGTIKLVKCPRLIDILLSHAGVFNHGKLGRSAFCNIHTIRTSFVCGSFQEISSRT